MTETTEATEVKEYTQYGTANGFKEWPDEIKQCCADNHKTTERHLGYHLWEVKCDRCRYKYQYDSS